MSGFYKNEDGTVYYAPNYVYGPYLEYVLLAEEKDEYIELDVLPIDGWYWFDSAEEAYAFFGLPLEVSDGPGLPE